MRYRDHSHIDEWAALVGETVGERARSETPLPRESDTLESRYRDDAGPRTDG